MPERLVSLLKGIMDLVDTPSGHILILLALFVGINDPKYKEELIGAMLYSLKARGNA